MSTTVNFEALKSMPVTKEPFPYLVVPGFVKNDAMTDIESDYPKVNVPGSLPLASLSYGENFKRFMQDISSEEMTAIMADKFDINLTNRPSTITVRARCRTTDGKIHTDSKSKLITVLIYMNDKWEKPGGRLRLLNSPDNLNDAFLEVPPAQGTLIAFLNQSNSWHGHESFEGERRVIQLNWVRDKSVVWFEQLRHRVSAFFKCLYN
jgi:SM-20-related protein